MRYILMCLVVVIATTVGINAINMVDKMQDQKLRQFCASVPIGASYDEICDKERH